jgi:heptosyltransferase-2
MKNTPLRILVMAPSWLGDAVMSLPLIEMLSAANVRVSVLASAYTARVYQGLDCVDELIVAPKAGRTRSAWQRGRAIRRIGFDGGLTLAPSFSSALTLFLSGLRHRVGFAADGRSALLTDALPVPRRRNEHLSHNYMRLGWRLLDKLDIPAADKIVAPHLHVYESERARIAAILRNREVPIDNYAVVVPGATYGPTKSWPADKYRALVGRLSVGGAVVVAGGAAERELGESLAGDNAGVCTVAGDTSLGELFALLAGARVVVANDSGAPHAATALNTPTVVIFGSTSPTWTKPLGDDVHVVREKVACAPCFLSQCPTELECYQGITVDRVADVIDGIERAASQGAGAH